MRKILVLGFLVLMILPFVSANGLGEYNNPNETSLSINNVIVNLNDFPNYIFVATCKTWCEKKVAFIACIPACSNYNWSYSCTNYYNFTSYNCTSSCECGKEGAKVYYYNYTDQGRERIEGPFYSKHLYKCYVYADTIGKEGKIESYYKRGPGSTCWTNSIYAIRKSDFNNTYLKSLNETQTYIEPSNKTQADEYFNSSGIKRVIEGVVYYKTVQSSSGIVSITYFYNVSLEETKYKPDRVEEKIQPSIYLVLPIIALFILLVIFIVRILKKKRK